MCTVAIKLIFDGIRRARLRLIWSTGDTMRTTILTSTVAACAVASLLAPAAAEAAPPARVKIAHGTSGFYQYDPSVAGTGPTYDAVAVHAQLRNCPVGDYVYWMTLVQDGVSYPVASTALGTGELLTGASTTPLVLGFTATACTRVWPRPPSPSTGRPTACRS